MQKAHETKYQTCADVGQFFAAPQADSETEPRRADSQALITMLQGDEIMTKSERRERTGAKHKDRGQLHECDWWRMWASRRSEDERQKRGIKQD